MRFCFAGVAVLGALLSLNGCEDEENQPRVSGPLPCDVQAVVESECSTCHGVEPKFGGPMSLMSTEDWHVPAVTDPAETMYHIAKERMNYRFVPDSEVSLQHIPIGPMPPAPNQPLEGENLRIMNDWIDNGAFAKSTPGACAAAPEEKPAPVPDPELDCTWHEFRAHADDRFDLPFKVGTARDAYYNFTFKSPWDKTVYARAFKPLIDNEKVLHHWLFFKKAGTLFRDGSVQISTGAHVGGQLINGWAPGGEPHFYDEKVGRILEPGYYNLEIHYNSDDPEAVDVSGMAVCYTEKEPEHVAELIWLGTDAILGDEASGICEPAEQTEPIHILSVTPHMHTKGRHIKAVINRADGSTDILHDHAFNFDTQATYYFDEDVIIYPGDTITTTCTYSEPTIFGRGTSQEMCYLYTAAWPIGALRDNKLLSLIHGPNTCLGLIPPGLGD